MRWTSGLTALALLAAVVPMMPTAAAANSCTATSSNTTCSFDCRSGAGYSVTVYALSGHIGELVGGSASCGGVTASNDPCVWVDVNNCTATNGGQSAGTGTCTWIRGSGATCSDVFALN